MNQSIPTPISTRLAEQSDIETILRFIQKKAAFDRSLGAFLGELETTEARLQKTLFDHPAFASVLLAEIDVEIHAAERPHPVGFALYYFRYSSFAARPSLWLDDLFVDREMRGRGAGLALMQRLAALALAQDCTHMAWTASPKNAVGITFYHQLGAKITGPQGDSLQFRWQSEQMLESAKIIKNKPLLTTLQQ
jgi:GNAT superfamily N-acetyltransferase